MTEETNPELNTPPHARAKRGGRGPSRASKSSSSQPQETTKKGKRAQRPKDPLFKDAISLYFTDGALTSFSVNPGLQVGQTQLEIDVVVRATETQTLGEIEERLKDTPFFFFAYLNAIEFKSVNDTFYLHDFYRTAGRALLAAASYYEKRSEALGKGQKAGRKAKKQPQAARVVSCLICAAYPQSVQEQLHLPFEPLEGQPTGFYYRPHAAELFLPGYLIVCSELPLEEKYYPLLVFATGTKLTDFIELVIDRELEVYVKYVAKLHAEEVAQAFAQRKRGGQLTTGEERLARTLIDVLGQDKVVEIVGRDKLAEQLGLESLIAMVQHLEGEGAELDKEQRLSLLKTLMSGMSDQELNTLLATTGIGSKVPASDEITTIPQNKGSEK